MIVTASVLQGLQVTAGPLAIHIGMLLTMCSLTIPEDCHRSPQGELHGLSGKQIFWLILGTHVVTATSKLLFAFEFPESWTFKETTERYNKRLRVFICVIQLVLFSELSFSWVLIPWQVDDDPSCGTDLDAWRRFKFFMILECFIFATNLSAAILFMLLRSVSHNQLMWDIEE